MDTKPFLNVVLFLLSIVLVGCDPPGEQICAGRGGDVIVEDLVQLTPFQEIYQQGDTVTIAVSIPSINDFFGATINLNAATNDFSGTMTFGSIQTLLEGNQLTIVKGSQGPTFNNFELPYNLDNGRYELELEIILNRAGDYSFPTANTEVFFVKGSTQCNLYNIGTNFEGRNAENIFSFTVE